jgi:enamine deaminase RidA (YjgF/YER057c/UK114 family)
MPNSNTPLAYAAAMEAGSHAGGSSAGLARSPVVRSTSGSATEFVISVRSEPRESVEALFSRLTTKLKQREGAILSLMIYGDIAAREETVKVIRRYLGAIDWPVLWVEGASCNGALLAGVQAFAIRGAELERLLVKGRVVGSMYEDGDARHCLIAGIGPDNPALPREEQAHQAFENLTTALERADFQLADVARTWFYNEKILDWYDGFNRVRTGYYARRPFRMGSSPASTGVAGRNPLGAALAMGAWAVQPLNGAARVAEIASPLQCPAPQYGSSFSRAVEIDSGGSRRLLISGTASIAPEGHSMWIGDIDKQITLTMEVIDAILRSRAMTFGDVTRATAYFKYPLDTAAFDAWQTRHGVSLPAVYVHCDICRDDLLFELELDAACPTSRPLH